MRYKKLLVCFCRGGGIYSVSIPLQLARKGERRDDEDDEDDEEDHEDDEDDEERYAKNPKKPGKRYFL